MSNKTDSTTIVGVLDVIRTSGTFIFDPAEAQLWLLNGSRMEAFVNRPIAGIANRVSRAKHGNELVLSEINNGVFAILLGMQAFADFSDADTAFAAFEAGLKHEVGVEIYLSRADWEQAVKATHPAQKRWFSACPEGEHGVTQSEETPSGENSTPALVKKPTSPEVGIEVCESGLVTFEPGEKIWFVTAGGELIPYLGVPLPHVFSSIGRRQEKTLLHGIADGTICLILDENAFGNYAGKPYKAYHQAFEEGLARTLKREVVFDATTFGAAVKATLPKVYAQWLEYAKTRVAPSMPVHVPAASPVKLIGAPSPVLVTSPIAVETVDEEEEQTQTEEDRPFVRASARDCELVANAIKARLPGWEVAHVRGLLDDGLLVRFTDQLKLQIGISDVAPEWFEDSKSVTKRSCETVLYRLHAALNCLTSLDELMAFEGLSNAIDRALRWPIALTKV